MIVVDTSALFSVFDDEEDATGLMHAIVASDRALIGAPTAFEFKLVVKKRAGEPGLERADRLLAIWPLEIVAFTPDLVSIATDALGRFGGWPASLNYGDCMAYALAKSLDVPLLYKGGDFAATDVRSAI